MQKRGDPSAALLLVLSGSEWQLFRFPGPIQEPVSGRARHLQFVPTSSGIWAWACLCNPVAEQRSRAAAGGG